MTLDPDTLSNRSLADLMSLSGRLAIVTGGAQGMGYAIARRLAEAGADLIIADVNESGVKIAAADFARSYNVRAEGMKVNVSSSADIAALACYADEHWGQLDIWINCAGIQPGKLLVETSDEEWHAMQDINLGGAFFGCREAAKRMTSVGKGVIINITSVCGYRGRPSLAHYCASKHGLAGLTSSLAMELGPSGVRVLCVSPGQTDTPGLRDALQTAAANGGASDQSFQTMMERGRSLMPLRRIGKPDDIARAVVFAASDLAAFVTATTIFADGGASAY